MKFLTKSNIIYFILTVAVIFPYFNSSHALLAGLLLSIIGLKNTITRFKSRLLQISIVLMGFGMNLDQVIDASKSGFLYTTISVISVIITGLILGKILGVKKHTSLLISSGTAICGGSAIAAVSSVIGADDDDICFSLAVVFVLNALALIIFPFLGHLLTMDQINFGNWVAIAIHDTSSVIGAAAVYGEEALEIATTVKLIRALWIIPLTIFIALFQSNKGKVKIPWFILFFVLAIVVAHLLPDYNNFFAGLKFIGKRGMVVAIFFIGSGLSLSNIKNVGLKTFSQGIILWLLTGGSSLLMLNGL